MNIVRFADGKCGIRRRAWWSLWIGYEYLDLESPHFWWSRDASFFRDCRGTREMVDSAMAYRDKGTPE